MRSLGCLVSCLLLLLAGCSTAPPRKQFFVAFSQCNNAEPYRAAQNALMTKLFAEAPDVKLVMREYDWLPAQQPFERTYRTFSNLDDMHENGIHDYLKFIKLGYGRASDHACKDIRAGIMTRDEGIEMVRKYDHVKSRRDLDRWLQYVGMTEDEFDTTCDTFRDPRVWRIENGQWVKDNIWGGSSAYGPTHLSQVAHSSK